MATQAGKIRFTGRFGDLIGYNRNGVFCMRSMPAEVRQTSATRKAAQDFGIASRNGKLIRQELAAHLHGRKDSAWCNRLNKSLVSSGLESIVGFRFNPHTGLEKFFESTPQLSDDHILHIPAQRLPALPRKATHIEIKMISSKIDFESGRVLQSVSNSKLFDLKQPFEGITFNAAIPGRGTLIVTLQVNAYQHHLPLFDKRYLATDIIAVVLPPAKTYHKKKKTKAARTQQTQSGRIIQIPASGIYFNNPPANSGSTDPRLMIQRE